MKFAKTIASVLLASVMMSVLCCGCTDTKETRKPRDPDRTRPTKTVDELPEDEILLICGHQNYAWGSQSRMTFVMSDGCVYSSEEYFDGYASGIAKGLSVEDRARLLQKYTEPVARIDEAKLLKLYKNIVNIDPDAKFIYEDEYACDAGTGYTNVYIGGEWVTISESGDRTGALDDRYARKTENLISGYLSSTDMKEAANVYSGSITFIGTFECPKANIKEPRRIITSLEELKAFEKDTGIRLSENESFENFYNTSYDVFGWMCIGVEIVMCDEYLSLEDVSADAFIVSDNYTGFAFIDDPVIDISDHAVDQKCYCHIVQLPGYNTEVYDAFLK